MADVLYTQEQLERLEGNENILQDVVKKTHEKFMRTSDNRDARVLIEAVTATNESIHKQASNKAKMEAIKSNDETKDLVGSLLLELSSNKNITVNINRNVTNDENVIIPLDIVDGETFIGPGNLELEDIKSDE